MNTRLKEIERINYMLKVLAEDFANPHLRRKLAEHLVEDVLAIVKIERILTESENLKEEELKATVKKQDECEECFDLNLYDPYEP